MGIDVVMNRCFHISVMLLLLMTPLRAEEPTVYDRVYGGLQELPHRQPGSEEFERSVALLEEVIRDAGLEPHRQTFNTLVPSATTCTFTVDGHPVPDALPFSPPTTSNLPNTYGETISGESVYCAWGLPEDFDGKTIRDRIVVLELGSRGLDQAMRAGAAAIVLVGNDEADVWQTMRGRPPAGTPVIYLDRPVADDLGLLQERRSCSLRLSMRWEDRVATNLWTRIPGTGTVFDLGLPEVVVLSATLDTFGLIPEQAPQLRQLANVALLAQLMHDLSQRRPQRDVVVVFLGAHVAAEEGMRHLYHAVDNVPQDSSVMETESDLFARLAADYSADAEESKSHVAFMQQDGFLLRDDYPGFFDVVHMLRDHLEELRNGVNYRLGQLYREKNDLVNEGLEITAAFEERGEDMEPAEREFLQQRQQDLQQGITAIDDGIAGSEDEPGLKDIKSRWNDLIRQVLMREISDEEYFDRLVARVRDVLSAAIEETRLLVEHVRSSRPLVQALIGRVVTCHYHFDLTAADRPWLFNLSGPLSIYGLGDGNSPFNIGGFRRHLSVWRDLYENMYTPAWQPAVLFAEACELNVRPDSYCAPALRSNPASVAHATGTNAYSLCSLGGYGMDELPLRRPVDLRGMIPQMQVVMDLASNARDLSLAYRSKRAKFNDRAVYRHDSAGERVGLLFQYQVKGGADIAGPARGAIAAFHTSRSKLEVPGALLSNWTRINSFGFIHEPLVGSRAGTRSQAYAYHPDGYQLYRPTGQRSKSAKVALRYGHGGYFNVPFVPGEYDLVMNPMFLVGSTDARFNPAMDMGGLGVEWVGDLHMSQPEDTWKLAADGLLLLGAETEIDLVKATEKLEFNGLSNDPDALIRLDATAQGMKDLGLLNEERLRVLRSRNIINDAAESLHATGGEYGEQAESAARADLWSEADSKRLIALTHEFRAYEPVHQVANDMVKAVVILLLLSIPFAFALERLVIGAVSIYRQIGGFAAVFLATFVLLYNLHPAFGLAATPIAIFLAFVIIMMSTAVIYVVMSKFKMEIMALQGLSSKSHSEQSDASTVMASIFIGISGMRNRPLKTFLTAITVVLLTFTILVFASFSSSVGIVESYLGQGEGVDRIEFRRSTMLRLPSELVQAVEEEYDEDYHVFRRGALYFDPTASSRDFLELAVANPNDGQSAPLKGVIGIDPAEAEHNPELRALIQDWHAQEQAGRPLFLASFLAQRLGLEVGDPVVLRGIPFVYAGSFVMNQLQVMSYMGGAKQVPPDFSSILQDLEKQASATVSEELQKIDTGSFRWVSPAEVAIVHYDDLASFDVDDGLTNGVMFYPDGDQDLQKDGGTLATLLLDPVYVKSADGAWNLFFTEAFKGSGLGEVLVPLLLGGLIIFSSLLGSIVDREREIFTFSALGLAPPNVAALFFAESAVYAVVGGVGGYLFSQVVAGILAVIASYGWFEAPEMNFSSLSSTYTILVVMATVMLSTIYPAIQAGKSANPGVARKWKMPQPVGRRLHFLFPFTVASHDMVGILSFIQEHFHNHADASLGSFAANNVRIQRLPEHPELGKNNYAIQAEVSLAPFDLGIFQRFRMVSRDSDIEGIKEVLVDVELVNGSPSAWQRSNRHFIADLRKQFLLWRSLPAESVAHYCSMTIHDAAVADHVSDSYLGVDASSQTDAAR